MALHAIKTDRGTIVMGDEGLKMFNKAMLEYIEKKYPETKLDKDVT